MVTLFITAIQLYTEFRYDINGINQKLEQIKISYQQSVSEAAWISDKNQLQTILDGISKLADIAYAEVKIGNSIKMTSGTLTDKDNIQINIDLKYLYNNKTIKIGEFRVVATLSAVYKRLLNRLWVILVSNALKTSLVAVFIYFIFVHLVTRHLTKISEFSREHTLDSADSVLVLDRNTEINDEFNVVVKSINDMHKRLHEQIEQINHQKQYLSMTLNSIGDAVITTDDSGHVTRLNPVAEKLTGWKTEDALNLPLRNIFSIVDASTNEPIDNPVEKVLSSGETVYLSNHTTLIAKNGNEYQIADSAAPIMDGEKVLGMVLVFNDVTDQYKMRKALQESEQRFRQLAENLNEVVWLGSPDWNEVFYVSPAYDKKWGLNVEELYKQPRVWIESVHPDDRQQVIYDIPTKAEHIQDVITFRDFRIKKTDGEILWIKARAYPIRDPEGEVIRIAGIAEDITASKEAEETLRRTQKMDALGKLTGGIAHDYNNMLGVVLGYSEHLKDLLEEHPDMQKYADKIIHAGERGAKLTKKLLFFSNNISSDISVVDINTVLTEEQDMLEKTLTARIKLAIKLSKDLWPVYLNESELEDAILNLSINAMHAIEGNGNLTIHTSNVTVDKSFAETLGLLSGDYVVLSIEDSGCGMDESTKARIFDPFFSTKGTGGSGLGLSQVYGFIKRCNGAVAVETELQQGTRFTLYFPRYCGDEQLNEQAENCIVTSLEGKEAILVVDDEVGLTELLNEILSKHGYRVFTAQNAATALEILKNDSVDLLISDIVMPDMDGYMLASIVKEKYPNIKILLASGFADNKQQVDDSSWRILQKPYKSKTVMEIIRKLFS